MPGEDYASLLLGVVWTFTSIATLFTAARFFCRISCKIRLGWDDFWAAFSLIMSFAMSATWTVYASYGGTVNASQSYDRTKSIGFSSWLSQTWCITAIITTKFAVAALIQRLQGAAFWRTRLLWFLCSVSAAWAIIQIGFVWGQCHPTSTLWDPQGNLEGVCWSPTVVVYNGMACSSFWALTDIALALIPVHMVMRLQMPLKRKIGICALLSTGLVAAALSIVRLSKLPADLEKTSDIVYQFVVFFILNSVEVNTLIISCCIPTLVPFYDLMRGRGLKRFRSKGSDSYGASINNDYSLSKFSQPTGGSMGRDMHGDWHPDPESMGSAETSIYVTREVNVGGSRRV